MPGTIAQLAPYLTADTGVGSSNLSPALITFEEINDETFSIATVPHLLIQGQLSVTGKICAVSTGQPDAA